MPARTPHFLAVGVAVLAAAGCSAAASSTAGSPAVPSSADGSSAATTSSPSSPAVSSEPPAPVPQGTPQDLAAVRASGEAVERSKTAAYVYEQTVKVLGENSMPLITRSGKLDFRRGLHEVQIDFTDPEADDDTPKSLTFLLSPGQVLIDNPSFTAKTGKRWTVLPADQLSALAQGAALVPALPGADVLRQAVSALPRVRVPGTSSYALYIKEYDALPLLNASAAQQLQQKTGKTTAQLQQEYSAVLELGVDLDEQGRLIILNADLTSMAAHYTKSLGDSSDDEGGQFTLRETVSDIGTAPAIDHPAAADIAAAPSN